MSFYDKYLKYKNKYIQLKTEYDNQLGGEKKTYTKLLNPTDSIENQITISYKYDDPISSYLIVINDFSIKIGTSDIPFLYKNFMVNEDFFYEYLDLKETNTENFYLIKFYINNRDLEDRKEENIVVSKKIKKN